MSETLPSTDLRIRLDLESFLKAVPRLFSDETCTPKLDAGITWKADDKSPADLNIRPVPSGFVSGAPEGGSASY